MSRSDPNYHEAYEKAYRAAADEVFAETDWGVSLEEIQEKSHNIARRVVQELPNSE